MRRPGGLFQEALNLCPGNQHAPKRPGASEQPALKQPIDCRTGYAQNIRRLFQSKGKPSRLPVSFDFFHRRSLLARLWCDRCNSLNLYAAKQRLKRGPSDDDGS
jgi:hypothetical protein